MLLHGSKHKGYKISDISEPFWMITVKNLGMVSHLNNGVGKAWASHNKLYGFPVFTSNESDLADFGNLGDTLPTGSSISTNYSIKTMEISFYTYQNTMLPECWSIKGKKHPLPNI